MSLLPALVAGGQVTYPYGTFSPWNAPEPITRAYIAPRTDGQAGSGTPSDPFNASSAAKFDALVQRFNKNAAIYYAPGVYYTEGWQAGQPQTANTNCYHVGAGIDKTIVRLAPDAFRRPGGNGFVTLFACDYNQRADGFEVWNMTLDGNANNNTAFKQGNNNITLIYATGNNILIQGDKIMGFGTTGGENFTVCLTPSEAAWKGYTFSHNHVQGCIFTQPATGNHDGASLCCVGSDAGITITDFQTLGNQFINVSSDFTYSHAMAGLFCQGNLVTGCQTGWYAEPGAGTNNLSPVTIQDNTFIGVPFVALATFHSNGQMGAIVFLNNLVILPNSDMDYAVGVCISGDPVTTHPAISSITVSGNEFLGVNQLAIQAAYYRCVDFTGFGNSQVVGKLTLTGNRVDGTVPSGREFVVDYYEVPSVTASGNIYFNGVTVPVTYTNQ